MIPNQNVKYVDIFPCASVATNLTAQTNTGNYADCLGYDNLTVILATGAWGATDAVATVIALQHGDTTDATSFADITGYIGGTSFTIPTSNVTAVAGVSTPQVVFSVPLQGKKRYIRPKFTLNTSATTLCHILGILSRSESAPTTATLANTRVLVQPT